MKNRIPQLETLTNLAIILIALILGATLISRFFTSQPVALRENAATLQPGATLPKSNVDWGRHERNLIFVLSTQCKYCHESAEFYQRLTARAANRQSLTTVAILPQPYEESKQYLAENKIVVDEVLKGNPGDLQVRGTPTLILADKNGIVLDVWVGKLPPEKEEEVFTRVFSEIARN